MSEQTYPRSTFDLQVAAEIAPATETAPKRFRALFATGRRIPWHGPFENVYVDVEGMVVDSQSQPVLLNHDTPIGFTTKIERTEAGMLAEGQLLDSPAANEVAQHAAQGFPWRCSCGIPPTSIEFVEQGATAMVNGEEITGPATVWRMPHLHEITFLATPADRHTGATVFRRDDESVGVATSITKAGAMAEKNEGDQKMTAQELADMYPELVTEAANIVKGWTEPEGEEAETTEEPPAEPEMMEGEPPAEEEDEEEKKMATAPAAMASAAGGEFAAEVAELLDVATSSQHQLCKSLVAELGAGTKTLAQCFKALAQDPRRNAAETRAGLEDAAPEALVESGSTAASSDTFEAKLRREWEGSAELQKQFSGQFELYQAEREAMACGAFK